MNMNGLTEEEKLEQAERIWQRLKAASEKSSSDFNDLMQFNSFTGAMLMGAQGLIVGSMLTHWTNEPLISILIGSAIGLYGIFRLKQSAKRRDQIVAEHDAEMRSISEDNRELRETPVVQGFEMARDAGFFDPTK